VFDRFLYLFEWNIVVFHPVLDNSVPTQPRAENLILPTDPPRTSNFSTYVSIIEARHCARVLRRVYKRPSFP